MPRTGTTPAEQRQHAEGGGRNGEPQRGGRHSLRVGTQRHVEGAVDRADDDEHVEAVPAGEWTEALHVFNVRHHRQSPPPTQVGDEIVVGCDRRHGLRPMCRRPDERTVVAQPVPKGPAMHNTHTTRTFTPARIVALALIAVLIGGLASLRLGSGTEHLKVPAARQGRRPRPAELRLRDREAATTRPTAERWSFRRTATSPTRG